MELIKIYQGNLVDARELHGFLESKRDFSNWITQRIKRYGFKEGVDYTSYNKIVERKKGATRRVEYNLTLNMAKELSMVENNDKGRQARLYFIEAEEIITLLRIKENKRFEAFTKLEITKGKLRQNVINLGGTDSNYIQIDVAGQKVLFNGQVIPDEELPTILLKGRDFATSMTIEILKEKPLSMEDIEEVNKLHHDDIRNVIVKDLGKKPEELPREEKIKKLGE